MQAAVKTSVAVFHPQMRFGGSEAFAMWTLEALKRDYDVTLISGGRLDLRALNAFYGTNICEDECKIIELTIPWPLHRVGWGAALRGAIVESQMRREVRRFDIPISAYNIANFGRPGIHRVADFSWDENVRREYDPLPSGVIGLAHRSRVLRKSYLALSRIIARDNRVAAFRGAGVILANSSWTRDLLQRRHGIKAEVIYSPVVTPPLSYPRRKKPQFVCLGRIDPEKRIERVVEILKGVRARGHRNFTLHIIGEVSETSYGRSVERLCRDENDWVVVEGRRSGEFKARLLWDSAYGIHARPGEAFGIAVAEMITAGCVPFVPAEGGPAEIVEHNPALVYESIESAIQKISEVLENHELEVRLREFVKRRAQAFSTDCFVRGIRRVVAEFRESDFAGQPAWN